MRLRVLVLAALAPLAACTTVAEAVRGPELAPVGYPSALVPREVNTLPLASVREPLPQAASANSLWRTGARAFFNDQRAGRVGDILTVQIDIDDKAQTINSTSTSRTAGITKGVPHFFGLETSLGKILPGAFDPANMIETYSSTSNEGAGAVNRSEKISLTIAAVVTGPGQAAVGPGAAELKLSRPTTRVALR